MNNNSTSEKLTFRELISKHKIEIPIIQRDYAQGREGKEELRKNFLTALLDVAKGKSLELDFVYGSINDKVLQPLDGQQRLTTLFLLHWFVALKENQLDDELKELLTKFTYETRTSSREFCIDLINKGIVYNEEKTVSELIIDSSWFFISWKRDPTIKSMLTMLDAIQQTFKNTTEVWNRLDNISFHYIELKNFGLSDDLYIKMNARGKALTDFENFKAKFEQYIKLVIYKTDENGNDILENGKKIILKDDWERNLNNLTETFAHKIDTLWTDLFWNYRDQTENIFDVQLLNFFKTMALINYTLKAKKDDKFRGIIDLFRSGKNISFNQYLDLGCFDEDYYKTLKIVLNKISDKNGLKTFLSNTTYADEKEIFNGAIKNNLGYAELLKLFALYQHFACEKDIEEDNLQNWMRIVRNLVEAHRLYYDNANTFADSLLFFSKLIPYRNNIVEYFRDSVNPEDKGFPKFIIEEEKLKAKLITESNEWKEAIIEIENHKYFNGQIGFLLEWSKINDEPDLNLFYEYIEKAKAIFNEDGLSNFENFLFERAMLAIGDYLLNKGQNHSFLIDKERDISWKRLLRDHNEKRKILRQIIDKISVETINEDLQAIIDDFNDTEDWRYHFVKQPEIILACGTSKYIRWDDDGKTILLLSSTTTSGYHKEYYSYSLFLRLKENLSLVCEDYQDQRSFSYYKYFKVVSDKKGEYILSYDYWSKKQYVLFTIDVWEKELFDSAVVFNSQEAIIDYLKI